MGDSATTDDAIIIGAGAAGLMCTIRAAERGRRVRLLEKNRKPAVKILMSGGTRCNITHDCGNRDIIAAFGPNGKFLHSALAALNPKQVVEFFEAEGVATKIEETGKIFPVSNKALDVLEALVRRLKRTQAQFHLEEPVSTLQKTGDVFTVTTSKGTYTAPKVVIATGGKSYPGCGTRGDGYAMAQQFGHTIVPPVPSLVPIKTEETWVKELSGLTLPDVTVKVFDQQQKLIERRGGFLFAHFGLTGPSPLDVSKLISRHANPKSLHLELDFAPGQTESQVDQFLQQESLASGKKLLAVVLSDHWPRRLSDAFLKLVNQPSDRKAAGLSKVDRQQLVQTIKRRHVSVTGTLGFEKAEVTAGGVTIAEVDSKNLQSKLCPGLHLIGEVLDLDGFIGGFNFQSAWSTGWLAGSNL